MHSHARRAAAVAYQFSNGAPMDSAPRRSVAASSAATSSAVKRQPSAPAASAACLAFLAPVRPCRCTLNASSSYCHIWGTCSVSPAANACLEQETTPRLAHIGYGLSI